MSNMAENTTGMSKMTDQVIATDLLIATKTGVRNLAYAITEAATPQVHEVLQRQMTDAISSHEQVSQYMIQKGWYKPYDVQGQLNMDLQIVQQSVSQMQNNQNNQNTQNQQNYQ